MNNKAFTLIELIIVIAIIGVIASSIIVAINPTERLGKAKDAQRLTEANNIEEAIERYTADNGSLPSNISSMSANTIYMISEAGDSESNDGTFIDCLDIAGQIEKYDIDSGSTLVPNYLSNIPIDPSETDPSTNGSGYYIIKNSNNIISVEPCDRYEYTDIPTSNLILVLRADSIEDLDDGDSIEDWYDSSSSGNNAEQTTTSTQPIYKTNILNNKPFVRFDGTNDNFDLDTLISSKPVTYFTVNKVLVYKENYLLGYMCGLKHEHGAYGLYSGGGVHGGDWVKWNDPVPTEYNIMTAIFDTDDTEDYAAIYQNGNFDSKVEGDPGTRDCSINNVGSYGGNDHFLNGDIAEIIIYDAILSDSDREAVEQYLSRKYNIALE